jgi:hypothetical protein
MTMNAGTLEAVARRTSLIALGAGLAATLTGPRAVGAKNKKNCKKKVEQKCQSQQAACQAIFNVACQGSSSCEMKLLPCCDHLAICDAEAGIKCIFDNINEL